MSKCRFFMTLKYHEYGVQSRSAFGIQLVLFADKESPVDGTGIPSQ